MPDLKALAGKVGRVIGEEGITAIPSRAYHYLERKREKHIWEKEILDSYSDVLFISGCNEQLPHPHRYRVLHQMEQLKAQGYHSETIYYTDIQPDLVRCYSVFVIFRCPMTLELAAFVREAHRLHKKVFYDVDDLVIDTCYTDLIPYLSKMAPSDRKAYDENVRKMGDMLSMCDGAITTTKALAEELSHYVPKVLINRNCASDEMLALSEAAWQKQKKEGRGTDGKIRLGYFSGSATHLDDLLLILPALCTILSRYPQVILQITGILELPKELEAYASQIEQEGFLDYRLLPERIAGVDINLAPITDTIFNRAKSENKWVEAALVRTPTIASRLGAFEEMVLDGRDGILTGNTTEEWVKNLERLILSEELRKKVGQTAYERCKKECVTLYNSRKLADFLQRERGCCGAFVLPALSISGGIRVALIHARMLYEEGCAVSLLTLQGEERWMEVEGMGQVPVLPARCEKIRGYFDFAAATMWNTCDFVKNCQNLGRRLYLVQNYEPDFYEPASPYRISASATYHQDPRMEYLTVSKWCQDWMRDTYGTQAAYLPNGIELKAFHPVKRSLTGKVRILVEGDSNAPHKNVDESFRIIEKLPRDRFEIWYMSYAGEPKSWYRVDRFLHKVPYEKIGKIYEQCDILLKTSLLESFSYPPLEMMATGGLVVALINDGNIEYLKDKENCLVYQTAGDIEAAAKLILELTEDQNLCEILAEGGLKTAASRDWSKIREIILQAYLR